MQSVDTLVPERGREPGGAAAGAERGAAAGGADADLDAVAVVVAAALGGDVLVVGPSGRPLARHEPGGMLGAEVAADLGRELTARGDFRPRIVTHPSLPDGAYAWPVSSTRGGGRARGWLVIVTADGRIDRVMRQVVRQAAAVVGLELMRRGGGETERRLTAGLVAEAIAGRTAGEEIGRRLAAFGIEGDVAVAVFGAHGVEAERAVQEALAAGELPAAVSTQEVGGRELLCAVVEVGERDPVEVAAEVRTRLVEEIGSERVGEIAVGVSRPRPAADLPRTFQEAYWALGAIERPHGQGAPVSSSTVDAVVGSWRDLGVESLLLAVADPDVLRLYCDRLLGPVLAGDPVYAAELLHSLELFILHNGQWERAARELHCHRHTLRYRMRKLEELTGRDLSRATDRIEFWLALRARELSHRAP